MRVQKLEESEQEPLSASQAAPSNDGNKKKRKASEDEDIARKRTKAANGSPDEISNAAAAPVLETRPIKPLKNGIQIPSRPATPLKSAETKPKPSTVDEDEWAAFEADIAATEAPAASTYDEGIISAPAMSTAELATKEKNEENRRKREQQEAELEGDKEDAARRMEEELEEIEVLEQRVKKLKDMREALRQKSKAGLEIGLPSGGGLQTTRADTNEEGDDEEDDEEYDEWDGFRMKS